MFKLKLLAWPVWEEMGSLGLELAKRVWWRAKGQWGLLWEGKRGASVRALGLNLSRICFVNEYLKVLGFGRIRFWRLLFLFWLSLVSKLYPTRLHFMYFLGFFPLIFFTLSGALKYMYVFLWVITLNLKVTMRIFVLDLQLCHQCSLLSFHFGCKSRCVFNLFLLNFRQLNDAYSEYLMVLTVIFRTCSFWKNAIRNEAQEFLWQVRHFWPQLSLTGRRIKLTVPLQITEAFPSLMLWYMSYALLRDNMNVPGG